MAKKILTNRFLEAHFFGSSLTNIFTFLSKENNSVGKEEKCGIFSINHHDQIFARKNVLIRCLILSRHILA